MSGAGTLNIGQVVKELQRKAVTLTAAQIRKMTENDRVEWGQWLIDAPESEIPIGHLGNTRADRLARKSLMKAAQRRIKRGVL